MVEQRYRHLGPVVGVCHQAAGYVVCGVVAAGDFLLFAKLPRLVSHVEIVRAPRRGHGRVGESQDLCVELIAGDQAQIVDLLIERDGVFFAALDVPHHDPGQAVDALQPDEIVFEL